MFRHPLFLSIFTFLLLGLALVARVPLDASPDEAAHWQYIEYIASNHQLPVFKAEMVPPAPGYEFHQPPLYYVSAAPAWAIAPAGVQNYWARLVSLLCGAATLIFIWKSARLLFPAERSIAILATAFAALWPLHLGVSAGSNNDALGGLWAAALFWCGARVLMGGSNLRDAALMGLFVGLGALTKNTVLVVAAVMLAALVAAQPQEKSPSRAGNLLVALGVAAVVAGPWWARNTLLYGDPLAMTVFNQAATEVSKGMFVFEQAGVPIPIYVRRMIWLIFMTMWGFFGGPNTAEAATKPFLGPVVPQLWLAPLMLAFGLAPLASLWGWRHLPASLQLSPAQKRVVGFFVFGFALVCLAWVQFAVAHVAGGQARYLHTALLPMCVLGAVGWRALWGDGRALKVASWALGALLLLMTLLNVLVWRTLV